MISEYVLLIRSILLALILFAVFAFGFYLQKSFEFCLPFIGCWNSYQDSIALAAIWTLMSISTLAMVAGLWLSWLTLVAKGWAMIMIGLSFLGLSSFWPAYFYLYGDHYGAIPLICALFCALIGIVAIDRGLKKRATIRSFENEIKSVIQSNES